jgi:dihydrofolate synthase/folylpolyglutamate synthase
MEISGALEKLFSLHQFGIKLGLDSTIKLLNFLGNPEKSLKCFHIAGSNGKGSTSSFIASILTESGFKTGLYTSPHLIRFNERIRINGTEIPDEFILKFMSLTEKYIDENPTTFFELTTAMSFMYFAEHKVDYAVIETGLGGRLDSTNVINPVASVITTISLEHTNILGNSLSDIAKEKAAIIKNNSKSFIGLIPENTKNIFYEYAKKNKSDLFFLSKYITAENNYVKVKTSGSEFTIYNTPLIGKHQLINAALAILSLSETLKDINPLNISKGISRVIENSRIQCRYEIFSEHPKIIFDSAHNPEGVESFINEFKNERENYSKTILIFGTMKDKNYIESIMKLAPYFDEIYATTIDYERAAGIEEIIKSAKQFGINAKPLPCPEEFIKNYLSEKNSNKCLVALGSIYILGEVKKKLLSLKRENK